MKRFKPASMALAANLIFAPLAAKADETCVVPPEDTSGQKTVNTGIGAVAGWFVLGPLGAVVGGVIGHDTTKKSEAERQAAREQSCKQQKRVENYWTNPLVAIDNASTTCAVTFGLPASEDKDPTLPDTTLIIGRDGNFSSPTGPSAPVQAKHIVAARQVCGALGFGSGR